VIIGNGLIAKTLNSCNHKNYTLLASGVANSVCPQKADFDREISLINTIDIKNCLVYFSTVSIYDNELKKRPYILHKLAMEQLIAKQFNDYIILRLPNIAAIAGNINTLIPAFYQKIINNEQVIISENANRYLLNQSQLCSIINQVLEKKEKNITINCVFKKSYTVKDIYIALCNIMQQNSNYKTIKGGNFYTVPTSHNFELFHTDLHSMLKAAINYNEPLQE